MSTEAQKRYREKNREQINEAQRVAARERRAAMDPEERKAYHRAHSRAWYAANKSRAAVTRLVRQGCDRSVAEEAAARTMCDICRTPVTHATGQRAGVIDHCHETKRVRGFLCASCNNGLGFFRSDPEFLRAAARYLER